MCSFTPQGLCTCPSFLWEHTSPTLGPINSYSYFRCYQQFLWEILSAPPVMPVFCPVITPTTLPFNHCFNPQVTLGLTRNGLSLSHLSPGILCPAHSQGTEWSSTNICYRNKMESLSSVLPLPRPLNPLCGAQASSGGRLELYKGRW